MARKYKIPVLLPSFLDECLALFSKPGCNLDLDALEQAFTVKTLTGCHLCITGVTSQTYRESISHIISSNGGFYSPDLTTDCTYLLVEGSSHNMEDQSYRLISSSPKILYALEKKIPIIRIEWLFACLEVQIQLSVKDFLVEVSPSQLPVELEITLADITRVQHQIPSYFEGMHFYLGDDIYSKCTTPGNSERLNLLRRLVLIPGGTRHGNLYDISMITHVVIQNQVVDELMFQSLFQFSKCQRKPVVVQDQWLFACFQAQRLVNIKPYESKSAIDLSSQAHSHTHSQATKPSDKTTVSNRSYRTVPGLSSIKHSIISGDQSSTISSINCHKKNPQLSSNPPISNLSVIGKRKSPTISATFPQIESFSHVTLDNSSSHFYQGIHPAKKPTLNVDEKQAHTHTMPIFSSLKFIMHPFFDMNASIQRAEMVDSIETNGGTVVEAFEPHDYLITPNIIFEGKNAGRKGRNQLWLRDCIKIGTIIDVGKGELFYTPVVGVNPNLLSGCTFSQTGYVGLERDYNRALLTAVRAVYHEGLGSLCTHLLCGHNRTGPKAKFALANNITIVTPEWLVASIKSGRKFSIASFPVSPISNLNDHSLHTDLPRKILFSPINLSQHKDTKVLGTDNNVTGKRLPLEGCVISLSPRVWHRRSQLHDLAVQLGATFAWTFDATCTHYIHQANMEIENFAEFKIVRRLKKIMVSPNWLLECQNSGCRLEEANFPHYTPLNHAKPPELLDSLKIKQIQTPSHISPTKLDFDRLIAEDQRKNASIKPNISYNLSTKNITKKTIRKISVSGINPELRSVIVEICDKHKNWGTSFIPGDWEPGITHLITGTPTESEKLLSALATGGVWILKPSFLESLKSASESDNNFLIKESEHEWDEFNGRLTPMFRVLRLRATLAFTDWRVILCIESKRSTWIANVLTAGGATVQVIESANFSAPIDLLENPTHVLCSSFNLKSRLPAFLGANDRFPTASTADLITHHLLSFGHNSLPLYN